LNSSRWCRMHWRSGRNCPLHPPLPPCRRSSAIWSGSRWPRRIFYTLEPIGRANLDSSLSRRAACRASPLRRPLSHCASGRTDLIVCGHLHLLAFCPRASAPSWTALGVAACLWLESWCRHPLAVKTGSPRSHGFVGPRLTPERLIEWSGIATGASIIAELYRQRRMEGREERRSRKRTGSPAERSYTPAGSTCCA